MTNNQLNNLEKNKSPRDMILSYIKEEIASVVDLHTQSPDESEWNMEEIYETMNTIFSVPLEVRINIEEIKDTAGSDEQDKTARGKLTAHLIDLAIKEYEKLENRINNDENLKSQLKEGESKPMNVIERMVMLRAIDMLWVDHIDAIDHMRQGIGLRGYGQKDPLVEYKKEAHRMFQELLASINKQIVYSIFKVSTVNNQQSTVNNDKNMNFSGPAKTGAVSSSQKQDLARRSPVGSSGAKAGGQKVGRNDPCPCGATKADGTPKKYKHCHGK